MVQANQAPLDTLYTEVAPDQAVAAAAAAGPMSRAHLPAATATRVPLAHTPKRPPQLDDPFTAQMLYRQARMAATADNPAAVLQNLDAALEASHSQPNIFLWQGIHALKSLDTGTLFRAIPDFLAALSHSPLAQGKLLILLQQSGTLATAIFWSALLLALYLANWRYLAHDWTALLLRNRSHTSLMALPLVVLLVLLVFLPGWLGFLALASVPLLVHCRTPGRGLLLGTWLVALALVFPWWPNLRQAVPTIDPGSEVIALDRACTFPSSATLRENLVGRLAKASDPLRRVRLLTALGIQDARAGNYDGSTKRFEAALAVQPHCMPAQVGKANNLYYLGKLDEAMTVYKQAVMNHPKCGEAHYNLAQVYFRKLFVPEATAELEVSRSLGYNPGKEIEADIHKGYAPVVYPGLTRNSYLAACKAEADHYPPQITLASWLPLLGIAGVPLYAMVGLPLLLAILVLMGRGTKTGPRECANCGVPLCTVCRKVRDGASMCAVCGEIAQRAQSDMILATLLKNRSRREGMATTQRVVRLGRFLPGTGHLASGHLWTAWLRLSLFTGGLFLVLAGWAFNTDQSFTTPGVLLPLEMIHPVWAPLPAVVWPGWTALPILMGLAMLAAAWLIALTDGGRLHQMLPERYSLIPVAAQEDHEPQYGVSAR